MVPLVEGAKGWKTLKKQAHNLKACLTYDKWSQGDDDDKWIPVEFVANRLVPPYIWPMDMLAIMSTDTARPLDQRKFDWKLVEKTYLGAARVQIWVKIANSSTP